MKNNTFKILAIGIIIVFSAFTTNTAHKPFFTAKFYYNDGTPYQRIDAGYNPFFPLSERSININNGITFRDILNWNQSGNSAIDYISGAAYVNTVFICNFDTNTDGDDSDGISLQETLDAIYAVYSLTYVVYPSFLAVDADHNFFTPPVLVYTTKAAAIY